jgi:general secretion pathway protein G
MTYELVLPWSAAGARPQRGRPFARAKARGFTAPELMIAVAILGVLATIAVPAYSDYRDRVDLAQAIIDIKGMDAMLQHYFDNNRDYPDDLGAIGMSAKLDPWGRPYQYTNLADIKGKGKARKDKNLVPINSDFDLYSLGKDGATSPPLNAKASRDDVVRASDGRFVGLARDFDP